MSGPLRDQFRAMAHRGYSMIKITATSYALAIAAALQASYGRNSAKQIAAEVGAGVSTVKKWLAGQNGPSGEHLLQLMAKRDEVWASVISLAGRDDGNSEQRERMRRALAILEGRDE
jgi:hypothetical protein